MDQVYICLSRIHFFPNSNNNNNKQTEQNKNQILLALDLCDLQPTTCTKANPGAIWMDVSTVHNQDDRCRRASLVKSYSGCFSPISGSGQMGSRKDWKLVLVRYVCNRWSLFPSPSSPASKDLMGDGAHYYGHQKIEEAMLLLASLLTCFWHPSCTRKWTWL